jgi:hypothetical protein
MKIIICANILVVVVHFACTGAIFDDIEETNPVIGSYLWELKQNQGKGNQEVELALLISLAKTYLQIGKNEMAIVMAEQALALALLKRNRETEMGMRMVIMKAMANEGKFDAAFLHQQIILTYKDSLLRVCDQKILGLQSEARRKNDVYKIELSQKNKDLYWNYGYMSFSGVLFFISLVGLIRLSAMRRYSKVPVPNNK